MRYLVGNTGFVGGNLAATGAFDKQFHSTNIQQAFGNSPELLVYAGLRAEKYLANQNAQADMTSIYLAFENIQRIAPRRLVLISTVDVYNPPKDVDEDSSIATDGLQAYGAHRYILEQMVRQAYPDALVVRLPGLYGQGLKKNFIFDLIHRIPTMLTSERFATLKPLSPLLERDYALDLSGFYRVRSLTGQERRQLRDFFDCCGFSAINFTDSRASFQMYPLRFLWCHIAAALESGLTMLNLATEPVTAQEIYYASEGKIFENLVSSVPDSYQMRSRYAGLLGGRDGYLLDRRFLLPDLTAFIHEQRLCLDREGV